MNKEPDIKSIKRSMELGVLRKDLLQPKHINLRSFDG